MSNWSFEGLGFDALCEDFSTRMLWLIPRYYAMRGRGRFVLNDSAGSRDAFSYFDLFTYLSRC